MAGMSVDSRKLEGFILGGVGGEGWREGRGGESQKGERTCLVYDSLIIDFFGAGGGFFKISFSETKKKKKYGRIKLS